MKLISHDSESWKSKIKLPASLVHDEDPLSGLQEDAFLLCPHIRKRSSFFHLFLEGHYFYSLGLHAHELITSQRSHFQRSSHLGIRLQHFNFRGESHSVHSTKLLRGLILVPTLKENPDEHPLLSVCKFGRLHQRTRVNTNSDIAAQTLQPSLKWAPLMSRLW